MLKCNLARCGEVVVMSGDTMIDQVVNDDGNGWTYEHPPSPRRADLTTLQCLATSKKYRAVSRLTSVNGFVITTLRAMTDSSHTSEFALDSNVQSTNIFRLSLCLPTEGQIERREEGRKTSAHTYPAKRRALPQRNRARKPLSRYSRRLRCLSRL
jgi:hypothetical protein